MGNQFIEELLLSNTKKETNFELNVLNIIKEYVLQPLKGIYRDNVNNKRIFSFFNTNWGQTIWLP